MQLLVIDDDAVIQSTLKTFFEQRHYEVLTASTGVEGLSDAQEKQPDIIILDMRLPDSHGIDVLKELKVRTPDSLVFIMTAYADLRDATEAIKLGAENFFQKPMELDELAAIIDRGAEKIRLRQELKLLKKPPYPIVGRSKTTQGLIHMVNLMAENHSTTLLIQGETGTGKELVARNIHDLSVRGEYPFIDINCSSIPESIIESELFGHEAGAFTDAKKTRKGLFEMADRGTLFLDEIGEMPLNAQSKLLRVLETLTVRRLGGSSDIPLNVRIIAATNSNLSSLMAEHAFREDLFYRLNVMTIDIPPLRDRPEDIPLLAEFFLNEMKDRMGKKHVDGFDSEAIASMGAYRWPGNIRELRNAIERALILGGASSFITQKGLALPEKQARQTASTALRDIEQQHIEKILASVSGNKTKTASLLGISRSTLSEKLKLYGTKG